MSQIENQIRKCRKAKGLTQKELARKVCLSQSHIGRLENGERNINITHLKKIANVLEVEPWQLLPIDMQPIIYIERTVEMTNNPFKYIGYGIRNSLAFILRNCFNCIVVYPKTTKKSK